MELYEQIRREYEHGAGTVRGIARKFGVHRREVRQALSSAVPAGRKVPQRERPKLSSVAPFSERTIAGLQRAKAQGRVGGRPKAEDADPKLVSKIAQLRAQRKSIRAIAADVKTSPNTILRLLRLKQETV